MNTGFFFDLDVRYFHGRFHKICLLGRCDFDMARMDVKKGHEYWLDIADYDLETARVMLKGKRFLYVGFMCHQVIEKALKGYYVAKFNDNPPFTHNLRYIAQKGGLLEKMDENQKRFVELLGPLNIEARYPTYKEKILKSLTRERCRDILNKTEELFLWTKERF